MTTTLRAPLPTLSLLIALALGGCGGAGSSSDANELAADAAGAAAAPATPEPANDDASSGGGGSADAEPDGGGEGSAGDTDATAAMPFETLYAQGVDRYLGLTFPSESTFLGASGTAHAFDPAQGPMCYSGNEFVMSTRDGDGDGGDLMIFLEGGGLCTPDTCRAIDRTLPGVPTRGIMDPADPENPAAGFDVAYVPYCDGSFFIGDVDVDSDGDGLDDRRFRGLQNLSAALNVIHATYPAPSRIVLAGNSAGGLGVQFALPLVRKLYPFAPIDLVNDSGIGILEPGRFEILLDYWNAAAFIPADCDDCLGADGNLTGLHDYQLVQDPDVRMAFVSSKEDEVVAPATPTFEEELLEAVAELGEAHPDRFASLVANGDEHTFIQKQFDYVIAGTTVKQWISDMLAGSPGWTSRVE